MGELLDRPPLVLMPVEHLTRRRKTAQLKCCGTSPGMGSTVPVDRRPADRRSG